MICDLVVVLFGADEGLFQRGDVVAVLDARNRPDGWGRIQRRRFLMIENVDISDALVANVRPDADGDGGARARINLDTLGRNNQQVRLAELYDPTCDSQPCVGQACDISGALLDKDSGEPIVAAAIGPMERTREFLTGGR